MHGLPFVYVHGATPPRTARGWTEVGMSVYKHVLVALGLITACGHVQASEPVPTAAAATAKFYGIELTDTQVAQLADVAPVAASTPLMFRVQPTIETVDMRQKLSYFPSNPDQRSVQDPLDMGETRCATPDLRST